MFPGRLMDELTHPKLTVMRNRFVALAMAFEASIDPVVKLNTEPAPRACARCSSPSGESARPGK